MGKMEIWIAWKNKRKQWENGIIWNIDGIMETHGKYWRQKDEQHYGPHVGGEAVKSYQVPGTWQYSIFFFLSLCCYFCSPVCFYY